MPLAINLPDPDVFYAAIDRMLEHGTRTKAAETLHCKRQYFCAHYLGQGDTEGGVIFQAMVGIGAIAARDQEGFLSLVAFLNSIFAEWVADGDERESFDELMSRALGQLGTVLKLRSQAGTKPEQIAAASSAQVTAAKLTAYLNERAGVVDINSRRAS